MLAAIKETQQALIALRLVKARLARALKYILCFCLRKQGLSGDNNCCGSEK
jgi:hypothetical protein